MEPPHGEALAERFEALAALREEGLIRHLGLSNVDTAHLAEARAIAPVVAVQNQFHAAKRDSEVVVDERVGDLPLGCAPLEGGGLDRPVAQGDRPEGGGREDVGGHTPGR